MYDIKITVAVYILCSLCMQCTSPSFELTGVAVHGLDGSFLKDAEITLKGTDISTMTDDNGVFSIKIPHSTWPDLAIREINSVEYLKGDALDTDLILVAKKKGFQQLEYNVRQKISGLTLSVLPEPIKFKVGDYSAEYLPFTSRLEKDVQWESIIDGIRLYYENRTKSIVPERQLYWDRDYSSFDAYVTSIAPNRSNFRKILGAVDDREPVAMERIRKVADTDKYTVYEVRWSVLKQIIPRPALQDWPDLDVPGKVYGEGLLIEPKGDSRGYVLAIPDADQNPEDLVGMGSGVEKESQFARRVAENGFTVVVPVVADRTNRWSRGTNRPSRTWVYSQAHEMGRTITGYEVQKMEAVIDWFADQGEIKGNIGIAGYGEGGLLAFYTAALDTRINSTMVSDYFAPREKIALEPIYRNVWGLLHEFGDAELASLVAPRSLVVEYSQVPDYNGSHLDGNEIEPPGELWTHSLSEVETEFNRISSLAGPYGKNHKLIKGDSDKTIPLGSAESMNRFMGELGFTGPMVLSDDLPQDEREEFGGAARMQRMVEQMVGHTQLLLRDSEYVRSDFVNKNKDQKGLRDYFKEEMVGWLDDDFLPINARTKLIDDQPGYTCYDVLMDVLPDVELWGVLCVPKGIKPDEKRPVVVLQHGRGGNPMTALSEGSGYFEAGRKLADRGFVVFTPFGNWTGETRFRWIDRIAKPTKASQWSTVAREHQQLIRWFRTLPFIDTSRIALYGKSIGGQTASLVASMLPEYALNINCAYFNEGARKESSIYFPTSFVYHVDSEMPMWNRGHTLEYAEMANHLIFPRPFMVEHGLQDGIAPPGWVEYEYAKVSEYYARMGKADRTELDLHDGGHIINFDKSFPFLHRHLNWPQP